MGGIFWTMEATILFFFGWCLSQTFAPLPVLHLFLSSMQHNWENKILIRCHRVWVFVVIFSQTIPKREVIFLVMRREKWMRRCPITLRLLVRHSYWNSVQEEADGSIQLNQILCHECFCTKSLSKWISRGHRVQFTLRNGRMWSCQHLPVTEEELLFTIGQFHCGH